MKSAPKYKENGDAIYDLTYGEPVEGSAETVHKTGVRLTRRGKLARTAAGVALVGLGVQTAVNSAPERAVEDAALSVSTASAHGVEAVIGKPLDKLLFASPLGKGDAYKKYDMTGNGNYKVYTVEPGDTEWDIASRTGLDPQHVDKVEHDLLDPQLPEGMNAGNLDPGTTIRLPLDSAIGQVPKK
jgi:nucleoid-associated protein YgaU